MLVLNTTLADMMTTASTVSLYIHTQMPTDYTELKKMALKMPDWVTNSKNPRKTACTLRLAPRLSSR